MRRRRLARPGGEIRRDAAATLRRVVGGFELEHEEDRTEDYRQTSIREREHFGWLKYGCTPPAFLTSLLTLVTDPHWLIFHVDLARAFFGFESCWMWHIGGVDPKHNGINPDAICKLLWEVYRRKGTRKRGASFFG